MKRRHMPRSLLSWSLVESNNIFVWGGFDLDKDIKKLVVDIIKGDEPRRRRVRRKNATEFDKKVQNAIAKAKADLDLGDMSAEIRTELIDKIVDSISTYTPWEKIGETYCCRQSFYNYRNRFIELVAEYLEFTK